SQAAAGSQVHYPAPAALIASEQAQTGNGALPAFPGGSGVALGKDAPPPGGSDDAFINNVFNLGPDNTPNQTGSTPIREAAPLVNLTLSNITIDSVSQRTHNPNSVFEADIEFTFDVHWTTSLVHPQFGLECVGGNSKFITDSSGTSRLHATGHLILYP